jgi:transglutaminase-like putative cysteine protease
MAVQQTVEKATSSRLVLLTAVLSLAVVSAAAFSRVFVGVRPTLQLAVAAAVAVLLAGALDRQHVLLATLASAAGLAVAIGLLVFHSTTKFGLPTATTFRAAVEAWETIGQIARTEVAPTPPYAPLLLAGLTAVWAASFSAHALASRARSPFLALLPPAGLLAFTSIILEEGARPLYVLVFLASAIAVLFADGLRRVRQWGPITAWQGRRRLHFGTTATLRGARWVAAVSLAVAVFLPGILPGYRATGLVHVRGDPETVRVTIDPIVQIRPSLLLSDPIPLFTVRSTEAAYWRFITLDRFDGQKWDSSNRDAVGGPQVLAGAVEPDVKVDAPARERIFTQHFEFLRLAQPWLPAASEPIEYRGPRPARYNPDSGALVVPGGASPQFSYDVKSREVVPTQKDLDAIASLDDSAPGRYTDLPSDMGNLPEITQIAQQLTRGAQTPYRKVLALQNYLRNPRFFTYKEDVPAGSGADDVLHFLTVSRAGYCEQFAATMAVLLRSLGIPARVAVGFTPGIVQGKEGESTIFRVTTNQAHAWVEVLFPDYGWLPFEPTPTRFNAIAAPYAFPIAASTGSTGATSPEVCRRPVTGQPFAEPGLTCGGAGPTGSPAAQRSLGEPPPTAPGPVSTPSQGLSGRTWIWLGILALAVLILAGIPAFKGSRRRVVLARARTPGERVLAAFGVLSDQATDVGLGRKPSETLREYRSRLAGSVQGLDGALEDLSRLAGRAAYSEGSLSIEEAERARSSARSVARLIRRSVGLQKRVAGWFRMERSILLRWAAG